ncbi:hypothetical protein [Mycolicibacterium fortuitum]|uniref:hypothetical protein n=1 Tax=Mycolicibacterium fortuitum TaxID=1766 RepID=UPI0014905F03|nr:hypothetical protein [Mycolicibacterium fortuitum]
MIAPTTRVLLSAFAIFTLIIDAVLRRYVTELGLDMAAFNSVSNDPVTLQRVNLDVADSKVLAAHDTPTFLPVRQRNSAEGVTRTSPQRWTQTPCQ